jgi:GGDEF domain-containing protein
VTRLIRWGGEPFAVLVESPDGDFLVPPLVFDADRKLIQGRKLIKRRSLLEAAVAASEEVAHPVITDATPALLADVDQRMARISETLGVPIR